MIYITNKLSLLLHHLIKNLTIQKFFKIPTKIYILINVFNDFTSGVNQCTIQTNFLVNNNSYYSGFCRL